MKPFLVALICLFFLSLFGGCRQFTRKFVAHKNRVVVIQPLGDISPSLTALVKKQIGQIHAQVILRPVQPLPGFAYYAPRNRYRADSLIQWLSIHDNADTVVIGLTNQDISVTKGKIADYGIMGYGYCPGNACVASTFRLSKKNIASQFCKVSLHELGHTQGLPHCDNTACLMRDANGGNPFEQTKGFCISCKAFLQSNGWNLL